MICKKRGVALERTGGAWITKPFQNWKHAIEKMKKHEESETHIQSCAAEAAAQQKGVYIHQLLQNVTS